MIVIGLIFAFGFIIIFRSEHLPTSIKIDKLSEVKPFANMRFYMFNLDPATIIIHNAQDNLTIGTQIYRIETLPENVHANTNQFLSAMDYSKIPYTYQVVQHPIIKTKANIEKPLKEGHLRALSNNTAQNLSGSPLQTSFKIFFNPSTSKILFCKSKTSYIPSVKSKKPSPLWNLQFCSS